MISRISSARLASNNNNSVRGDMVIFLKFKSMSLILLPTPVPPGSRVCTTSNPSFRKSPAANLECVLLPHPSGPSKVIKIPFFKLFFAIPAPLSYPPG